MSGDRHIEIVAAIGHAFAPMLPAGQISFYITGLILLAPTPCTAMVFV